MVQKVAKIEFLPLIYFRGRLRYQNSTYAMEGRGTPYVKSFVNAARTT